MIIAGGKEYPIISIDPDTGFERIFEHQSSNSEHSLVVVPLMREFAVKYSNKKGTVALLAYSRYQAIDWFVRGQIDNNVIANLGFRIDVPGDHGSHPIVSKSNLDQVQRYGDIEVVGQNKKGFPLYRASLCVSPQMILRFFKRTWQPNVDGNGSRVCIPEIRPGYYIDDTRILPHKVAIDHNRSSLQVLNHIPDLNP